PPAPSPAARPAAPAPTPVRPKAPAAKAPIAKPPGAPQAIPKPTIRRTDLPPASPAAMDMAGLRRSIDTCMSCGLSAGAMGSGALPGRGARKPRLLFVTDFAGPAERRYQKVLAPELGQMLQRITAALGVQPSEIYLTSAVKCPLPGGSLPKPSEVEACSSWLRRELELLEPTAIVAFGALATRALFGPTEDFEALRGRLLTFNKVPAIVTQPPRDMHADPSLKARAWNELKLLGPALGIDPS
ncbi:MAG: uracil-DNA glycosylase, partial [Planctomycetota bacterium]|nr:uracil-DNA glycosylase [Planctomycetota bacterium]